MCPYLVKSAGRERPAVNNRRDTTPGAAAFTASSHPDSRSLQEFN